MAIAHVHTDTTQDISGGAATITFTLPSGVAATDVVIALIGDTDTSTNPATYSAPSGWTAIGSSFAENDGFNGVRVTAWWALGNVANLAFTRSGTTFNAGAVCAAFSGVDNNNAIDVAGSGDGSTGAASVTCTSITIATANAWDMIVACDLNNGTYSATNFTVSENGALNCATAILYNTTPKSTGATGTAVLNDNAAAGSQIIATLRFALKPAGAAAARVPYNPWPQLGPILAQ